MSRFVPPFTRASKLMRGAADAAFSRHGVRVGQNLVLEVLWEENDLTPGEIARRLRVSTPTVVKMVARMETAGLVSRRRDAEDARLVRLSVTERGRAVRGAIEGELRRLEEQATRSLSAAERGQLEATLATLVANLEAIPDRDEAAV